MIIVLVSMFATFVISAVAARKLAARRGRNTALWAALGLCLGPLVFPPLLLSRKRSAA